MRRPLMVGALAAAVIALFASAAVGVGTIGGPSSGQTTEPGYGPGSGSGMMGGRGQNLPSVMMGGQGQSPAAAMMGGSMMGSVGSMGSAIWYHTWHGAFIALEDS
jgi:hypothetical protein